MFSMYGFIIFKHIRFRLFTLKLLHLVLKYEVQYNSFVKNWFEINITIED